MFHSFCFTINNYSLEDFADIEELIKRSQYTICGFEIGDQGTPHIQGYTELLKKTRFNSLKNIIKRAHIEARKGTAEQAATYCKKEGNWLEWGERRKQGCRNDLDRVRISALEEGLRGVTAIYNLQQIKVAEKFLTYNEEPRDWKPEVIWIWGPTGTGKSRKARELCKEDVYTKNSGSKWWDGYDGHEYIIIDDFRDSWWEITYMLGLLDRYEFQVEIKGGYRQIRARTIVITSAKNPEDCYRSTGEAINQLIRRIDKIEHLVPDVPKVEEVIL